jgi:hypothetical protein
VDLSGELQDALSCRGLARVYVGKNADIAVRTQVFHVSISVATAGDGQLIRTQGANAPRDPVGSGFRARIIAAPKPLNQRNLGQIHR